MQQGARLVLFSPPSLERCGDEGNVGDVESACLITEHGLQRSHCHCREPAPKNYFRWMFLSCMGEFNFIYFFFKEVRDRTWQVVPGSYLNKASPRDHRVSGARSL